jgi:uncharacterized Zn finger protein
VIEPLCESCGRDAASTSFEPVDENMARCGNCGSLVWLADPDESGPGDERA